MLLERLCAEIEADPGLFTLAAVRRALIDLEVGGSDVDGLITLGVDLDKFTGDFARWLHDRVPLALAHRAIESFNAQANGGRGSSTARSICRSLARLDLADARRIFSNDGDKVRQYPALYSTIEASVVGCRSHGTPYYCPTCFAE